MDVTQSDVTQLLQQLDDLLQQVDHLASSLPQQETERACYLQVVEDAKQRGNAATPPGTTTSAAEEELQQLKRVLEATTQAKLAAEQRSADILHKREEALQKTLRDVERLENQDAVHKQELSTLSTQVQRLEHMLQQQQRNTDSMEQLQHMLDTALKEQQQNATEIATRLESFSVAATVFQEMLDEQERVHVAQRETIARLRGELQQEAGKVAALQIQLAQRDKDLAVLQGQLDASTAREQQLQGCNDTLRARTEDLAALVNASKRE